MQYIICCLLFAVGVFSCNYLPGLPTEFWHGLLILVGLGCFVWILPLSNRVYLISVSIGLLYGLASASAFHARLLPKTMEAEWLDAEFQLISIPYRDGRATRFDVYLQRAWHDGHDKRVAVEGLHGKVRLSIYDWRRRTVKAEGSLSTAEGSLPGAEGSLPVPKGSLPVAKGSLPVAKGSAFTVGQVIRARIKLKRPRGLMNPGQFDYQKWLISKGYIAYGYMKPDYQIKTLDEGFGSPVALIRQGCIFFLRLSESVIEAQRVLGLRYVGIHSALSVGHKENLTPDLKQTLIDTGTLHLMAVSGLHVGMVFGLGYGLGLLLYRLALAANFVLKASVESRFLSGFGISSVGYALFTRLSAAGFAGMMGIVFASFYAGMAGFAMPTLRALVMIFALLLPRYLLLRVTPWLSLSIAVAVIAFIDPRASLNHGFWLSFGAVFLILLTQYSRKTARANEHSEHRLVTRLILGSLDLVRIQWVFLVGFAGVVGLLQGQIPLTGYVANLVAVPLVGLVLLPLEVMAMISVLVSIEWAQSLWLLADKLMQPLMAYLAWLESWPWTRIDVNSPTLSGSLALLVLFIVLVWLPDVRVIRLAIVSVLCLLLPWYSKDYVFEVIVFDVGQGLSVLLRQPGYALLYDVGPGYSGGRSAGRDIVGPSLGRLGHRYLDDLILSHPDTDHVGGYLGLLEEVSARRTWVGRFFDSGNPAVSQHSCMDGLSWQRGEFVYTFLSPSEPDRGEARESDNNRSCVLQVSGLGLNILLPGDIDAGVERNLVIHPNLTSPVDVLIAPHHGSKSSSSRALIKAIQPNQVVVSAAYNNRFGHPHKQVMARYGAFGAELYNTAYQGQVRVTWRKTKYETLQPETELFSEQRRYWWQK